VSRRPNWFVGWPLSLPTDWLTRLRPPPRVRLFHPDDLHATVAFFGPVSAEAARAAFSALPPPAGDAVQARWGPVVPMGDPRRPSALSALLSSDGGELRAFIQLNRPRLLERAGARPDARTPRPHVTLARPQRRAGPADRAAAVAWAAGLRMPVERSVIDRIALYSWSDDRRARLFRVVDSRPL